MSGFQQQLEQEIEKRGLTQVDADKATKKQKKVVPSLFSLSSFFKGVLLVALLAGGLYGWAYYTKNKTLENLQEKLPSKTAIVGRDNTDVYRLKDAQPVLRMPEVNVAPSNVLSRADEQKPEKLPSKENQRSDDNDLQRTKGGALVSAPIPGLYETRGSHILPIIRSSDNLSAFEAYKKPFQKSADKPLLSIVFYNVGLSSQRTQGLIDNFPAEVTFSFSPYKQNLKTLTDAARQDGHEVWLTLPLETKTYPANDPGPSTLFINASLEQNTARLHQTMGSTVGYAGFVSQKDHNFRREDASVNPSIQEIFTRGLAILDSNPSLYSFVGDIAARNNYPNAKNNFWLDDDLSSLAMNQKIRQVIEYGQSGGNVVMMLRPYPASIKALQKFLNSAAADQFQLAPVSAQVQYGE